MQSENPSSARAILNIVFSGSTPMTRLEHALQSFSAGQVDELGKFLAQNAPAKDVVGAMIDDYRRSEDSVQESWHRPLVLLEQMWCATNLYGGRFFDQSKAIGDKQNSDLFDVLVRLCGRLCRTGREALGLLRTGYPVGAMTRWRLMHETAVVAMFLVKHGNAAARSYKDHEVVEADNYMDAYEPYAKRHGLDPYTAEERVILRIKRTQILANRKETFLSDWGWAADWVAKPSFEKLSRDVGLFADYDCLYKMANHATHPTSRGLTISLGQPSAEVVLAGPSVYGLGVPIQCVARSLLIMVVSLSQALPSAEGNVVRATLTRWLDEVEKGCTEVASVLSKTDR